MEVCSPLGDVVPRYCLSHSAFIRSRLAFLGGSHRKHRQLPSSVCHASCRLQVRQIGTSSGSVVLSVQSSDVLCCLISVMPDICLRPPKRPPPKQMPIRHMWHAVTTTTATLYYIERLRRWCFDHCNENKHCSGTVFRWFTSGNFRKLGYMPSWLVSCGC